MTLRILVPNTPLATGALAQCIEVGDRLHQLNAVDFVLKPLVDLQERDNAAFPEQRRDRLAIGVAVHRPLEQDRADHLVAVEAG